MLHAFLQVFARYGHYPNPSFHQQQGQKRQCQDETYSLFIYQDENEDEDENQGFRYFLYGLKQTCDY